MYMISSMNIYYVNYSPGLDPRLTYIKAIYHQLPKPTCMVSEENKGSKVDCL